MDDLVLSIFHGADLFGRGFEQEGFCVVRAGEIELGFDIRNFSPVRHKFDGIIAGTPCQKFSSANRNKTHTAINCDCEGCKMLFEFKRVVTQAAPDWFLLENVPTVPNVTIPGYKVQRFDLNAKECGLKQNRLRHFQFGSKTGVELWIERNSFAESHLEPCCMASEGKKGKRRAFADFCELQGLPRDFKLPMLSIAKNYQVVGNGVAVPMARLIANSIRRQITLRNHNFHPDSHAGQSQTKPVQSQFDCVSTAENNYRAVTLCKCGCGRRVTGRQKAANAACRKRLERKRKSGTNHNYL